MDHSVVMEELVSKHEAEGIIGRIDHLVNRGRALLAAAFVASVVLWGCTGAYADSLAVDFEPPAYTTGSVDQQPAANIPPNTWGGQYPPGIAINPSLDQGVTSADAHGGTRSFRMSSSFATGSFGDQVFSPSLLNGAGEPGAIAGGLSGGTLQPRFAGTIFFKSVTAAVQDSHVVISADRGDGARMTWIQVSDNVVDPPSACSDSGNTCTTNAECTAGVADCLPDGRSGLSVSFYDYRVPGNVLDCGGQQDTEGKCFMFATLANHLSRTTWHRIDFEMEFYAGEANDVVRVSVDGGPPFRGTSWEDYFRNNQNPPFTSPPTVDSLLFRAGGAAEGSAGDGFYFDDLSYASSALNCQGNRYVATTGSDTFNDCSGTTAPCATIQHAIDVACAGDTVNVAAGTYAEQVAIGKSLTVVGAGAAMTTIQTPGTLPAEGNVVTIQGTGVSVDLSGVTVNGPGPGGCGSIGAGILVRASANANLHDSTISNIRDNPLSGCQNGRGIQIGDHDGSTPATATVTHNTIIGYQKNGVDLRNAATTASITDNVITGAGPQAVIAQNGVVIVNAGGSVSNNAISGNECNHSSCGPDPITQNQSAGVLLVSAQVNTAVSGNEVTNNDIGIYNNAVGVTSISRNELASNRFEGIFLDQGNAVVTSNQVQGGNIGVAVVSFTGNTGDSAGTLSCNGITGGGTGIELIDEDSLDAFIPTITASTNAIDGNGTGINNTTTTSVNAEGNWWGCAAGPGNPGCDTVIGPVDSLSSLAGAPACSAFASVSSCVGVPDGMLCSNGDICEGGVCVSSDSLTLSMVRLTANTSKVAGRNYGAAAIYAQVNDHSTGGGLATDLVAGAVTLKVTAGSTFNATLALKGCTAVGKSVIRCRDSTGTTRATFRRVVFARPLPLIYTIHVSGTKLGTPQAGSVQPTGPVTVVLHQTTVDRPDGTNSCKPSGRTALICHGS